MRSQTVGLLLLTPVNEFINPQCRKEAINSLGESVQARHFRTKALREGIVTLPIKPAEIDAGRLMFGSTAPILEGSVVTK